MLFPLQICNGKAFVARCEVNKLIINVYDFMIKTADFILVHTASVPFPRNGDKTLRLKYYGFSDCNFEKKGIGFPFLVVVYSGKTTLLVVYTYHESCKETTCFLELGTCFHYIPETLSHQTFFTCLGPRLIWTSEEHIILFPCSDNSIKHGTQTLKSPWKDSFKRLLHCSALECTFLDFQKVCFLLVIQTFLLDAESSDIKICLLYEDQQTGLLEKDVKLLIRDNFFPDQYTSLISFVDVAVKNFAKSLNNIQSTDLCIENCTVICTLSKQFLLFTNGCPKYCCTIPFCDVLYLAKYIYYPTLQTYYLLQGGDALCAIKREENNRTLQCFENWENISSIIIGDVLQKGSSQILLLHNSCSDGLLQFYTLTDIHAIYHPLTVSQGISDNKRNAIVGLRHRLIAGQAALTEAENNVKVKQMAIENILCSLQNPSISFNSEEFLLDTARLVTITPLPNSAAVLHENISFGSKSNFAITVLGKWSCVMNDQWMIGMNLKNISKRIVNNVCAYSTFGGQLLKVTYKLFTHHTNVLKQSLENSDSSENIIKPNEIVSLVVAAPLPSFLSSNIFVTCVLSWIAYIDNEHNGSVTQQISTHHSLNIKSIINRNNRYFKGLTPSEQLMCFRVQQCKMQLTVKSMHNDLKFLEKMMVSHCHSPCQVSHLFYSTFMFLDTTSPLHGLNFSVNHLNRFNVEIEIYYRKDADIFIFIHWLYEVLPEDIIILSKSFSCQKSSKSRIQLLSSLKEEVKNLTATCITVSSQRNALYEKTVHLKDMQKYYISLKDEIANDSFVISRKKYEASRKLLLQYEISTDFAAVIYE